LRRCPGGFVFYTVYEHNIEGSVHKRFISIYFRFSFFTLSDGSQRARQACDVSFSNFVTWESYKPSKNGAICASAYLLCAQSLLVFKLNMMMIMMHKGSICSDGTFVHYNIIHITSTVSVPKGSISRC